LTSNFPSNAKQYIKNIGKNIICYSITTFLAQTFLAQIVETKPTFRLSLGFGEGEGRGLWGRGEHEKIEKSFIKILKECFCIS